MGWKEVISFPDKPCVVRPDHMGAPARGLPSLMELRALQEPVAIPGRDAHVESVALAIEGEGHRYACVAERPYAPKEAREARDLGPSDRENEVAGTQARPLRRAIGREAHDDDLVFDIRREE